MTEKTDRDLRASGLVETAKAKINLTLEVAGRRDDGYHELKSLVVFSDFGDKLEFQSGADYSLQVGGPFGAAIEGHNLLETIASRVMMEARSCHDELPAGPGAIQLEKNIPVAAGLGGGSSDGAALLRLMNRAGLVELSDDFITTCGKLYGADVPVSIPSVPAFMAGIGELLSPVQNMPELFMLLVNPGVMVPTGQIFSRLAAPLISSDMAARGRLELQTLASRGFKTLDDVVDYMNTAPNDLSAAAIDVAPEIKEVVEALTLQEGCAIARMTGSGATCFGLFTSYEEMAAAERVISAGAPNWWVQASRVAGA